MAKFHVRLKETVLTPILVEAATEVEAIKKAEAGDGEPMPSEQEVLERLDATSVKRIGATVGTRKTAENVNVLEGMKCPKCGQEDEFSIVGHAVFEVTDEGTGDVGDVEWDDKDSAWCKQCGWSGRVHQLRGGVSKAASAGGYEATASAVPLSKRQAGYDPGDVETGACPKCGQRMMTNIDPAGKVEQECLCGNKVKHPAASAEDEGLSGQTNMSEAEGEERKAASLTRRQEIKEGGS